MLLMCTEKKENNTIHLERINLSSPVQEQKKVFVVTVIATHNTSKM